MRPARPITGVTVPQPDDSSAPHALGINAPAFRYTKLDLSTERADVRLDFGGNVLAVHGSSSPLAYVRVAFDDRGKSDKLIARDGLIVRGLPFNRLVISNPVQDFQWLGILTCRHPAPGFDIRNPPDIGWSGLIRSGRVYSRRTYQASVAGEYSTAILYNPPDSEDVLLLRAATGNNNSTYVGTLSQDGATVITTFATLDTVQGQVYGSHYQTNGSYRAPSAQIYLGTDAALNMQTYDTWWESNGTIQINWVANLFRDIDSVPIFPGYYAAIQQTTVAQSLSAWVAWAEVPLDVWRG